MRFWAHDRWGFPLPDGHRFPLAKYRLLREAVEAEGLGEVRPSPPATWEALHAVHDAAYLERVRTGTMTVREQRALGLPWSPELVALSDAVDCCASHRPTPTSSSSSPEPTPGKETASAVSP